MEGGGELEGPGVEKVWGGRGGWEGRRGRGGRGGRARERGEWVEGAGERGRQEVSWRGEREIHEALIYLLNWGGALKAEEVGQIPQ